MTKLINSIYLICYYTLLIFKLNVIKIIFYHEETEQSSQIFISVCVLIAAYNEIKSIFNTYPIIDDLIKYQNGIKTFDFLLTYYLCKCQIYKPLIAIYIGAILISIRKLLNCKQRLIYSSQPLFRFAAIKIIIQLLCDLCILEIILGIIFNNHVQFKDLPNIVNITLVFANSYGNEFQMESDGYQMYFKIGIHLLILNYLFFQVDSDTSSKIFMVFFCLRVIQNELLKCKKLSFNLVNEIGLKQCLLKMNEYQEQVNQNEEVFLVQYEFPNNVLELENVENEQVNILTKLAYAQAHLKKIQLKKGELQLEITYSTMNSLANILGIISKVAIIKYLTTSKYLLLFKYESWTDRYNFNQQEIDLICLHRTINHPFEQPFIYQRKEYQSNVYLLMILAFKKNIQQYMDFSTDQIIYDLFGS